MVQERLLFNCPEGTQRLMSQNKLKVSNKVALAHPTCCMQPS